MTRRLQGPCCDPAAEEAAQLSPSAPPMPMSLSTVLEGGETCWPWRSRPGCPTRTPSPAKAVAPPSGDRLLVASDPKSHGLS